MIKRGAWHHDRLYLTVRRLSIRIRKVVCLMRATVMNFAQRVY